MTLKVIDANLAKITKTGNVWNALVHDTLVMILEHAEKHGDCTRAIALVNAMPQGSNKTAVINSFRDYSPIGISVKNNKCEFHKKGSKLYKPFDVAGYKANPWYARQEANPELPDTTLEQAHKYIYQLATKLQKRIDEGKTAENDVEPLKSVVADLKALGGKQYRAQKAAAA